MSGSDNDQIDHLSEIKALLTDLKSTSKKQKESNDTLVSRFNGHEDLVSSRLKSLVAAHIELESRVNAIRDLRDQQTNVNLLVHIART